MKKGFTLIFIIAISFAAAYLLCGIIIPEDFFPAVSSSLIGGKESFQVISADPGTLLQVVWAYEAKVQQPQRQKVENYQRGQDLSFKRFHTDNGWSISEEGYLQRDAHEAAFSFPYPKYSNNIFVFCLKTSGGDALVRHDYPGGHSFYRIEGKNSDALPLSSAVNSDFSWKIPQWGCTLIIGGLSSLILVFFFLKWNRNHPFVDPEPLPETKTETPPWLYAAAFLIPVILALIVCGISGFVPFGDRTFIYNDMLNQNYKFILYLKNMPKEGNDLFYSFSKVLGGDMLSLFSFYFNNPLYFLVLFFPESQIPLFCTIIIILHLGLAGLSMCIYLRKNGRSPSGSILFSCAYALMSFNIVCAENLHFLTCMVLLPIVMLGLEREIRQQKPLLYILFLTFSLICNVYFGWMVCLFSLIWFIFIVISENRKTFRSDFVSFLMHSMLAVGLAMFVILPFAAALRIGTKTFSIENLKPEIINVLPTLFSKLVTGAFDHEQIEYGGPSLFCGTVTTVFAILFFFQKEQPYRLRLSALFPVLVFLLSFSVSTFYLIWHGFNYPIWWPARFAFTFGFFLVFCASAAFDKQAVTAFEKGIVFAIITLICLIVKLGNYSYISDRFLLMDLAFAAGCLFLISLKTGEGLQAVLFALLLLPDLGVNMSRIWVRNFEETYPKTAMTADEYARQYEQLYRPIMDFKTTDPQFYRTEYAMHTGENPGILYSTNGFSHFSSSSDNNSVRLLLDRLGFSSRYRLSAIANYRYGSAMAADSLLGIKYLVSETGLDKKPYPVLFQNPSILFQQNPISSSIGLVSSPDILDVILIENEIFENLEHIYTAIAGETVQLFSPAKNMTLQAENLTASASDQYTTWEKNAPYLPGILTWTIPVEKEEMLYVYFPVLSQRTGYVSLNGKLIGKTIDPHNYGMIPLGTFCPGSLITVSLEFNADYIDLFDPLFYYEDQEALRNLFDGKINTLKNIIKHSSSHLEAEISEVTENQWLFLTIPYTDEWQIKVNGKSAPAEKVLDALMAVPLEAGDNHLEMRYRPMGFLPGTAVSLMSLLVLILIERKRKKDSH